MKNKLKKYNDFLNESLVTRPKLSNFELKGILERQDKNSLSKYKDDFAESVINMVDYFPGYFSDMCKKEDANPENDYQEMQKLLDRKGWNFESIKNLFSEESNNLTGSDFMSWFNSHPLDSINGHCDIYLYFTAKNLGLDPNQIRLGGNGWVEGGERDESWIRYSYGYHQTKYGQLMLDQIGMTIEEFTQEALVYMQEYIKENWDVSLIRSMENALALQSDGKKYPLSNPLRKLLESLDIKEYTVVEEDRMIIYTTEICSVINKEGLAKVNPQDLANSLIKQYEWVDIDMQEIDGDVIIWGKFKVDF